MAVNFRMNAHKKDNRRMTIRLSGDFDGSSAWELVHMLLEHSGKVDLVELDTRGLKTLVPFGRNVFLAQTGAIKRKPGRTLFVVSGPYADELGGEDMPRTVRPAKVDP